MNGVSAVAVLQVGGSGDEIPLSDWAVSLVLECCCRTPVDWPTAVAEDPSLARWLAARMPREATLRDIAACIDSIAQQKPITLFASSITAAAIDDGGWQAFQCWWRRESATTRLVRSTLIEWDATTGACLPVLCQLIRSSSSPDAFERGTRPFALMTSCEADRQIVGAIERAQTRLGNDRQLVDEYLSTEQHARVNQALSPLHVLLPELLRDLVELHGLRDRFEERLEQEKLLSMKELAYGASHEINNPLANISTRAQVLLREESDPERRRSLATINSQAFRAHEMIADMMLFAKPPALELQPLNPQQLLDSVVGEIAAELPPSIELRREDADIIPTTLEADPIQLRVAIQAICTNAIEAMEGQGQLVIRLRRRAVDWQHAQGVAEIEIQDDGPGISPDVRKHLFDPFYSGREAGRGLGFGLSKAWRIVQLHGGQICVDSQAGQGATFTLCLPVCRRSQIGGDQASG